VLDDLFAKFVSADQHAFAEELYMTVDQAREIREAGMTIGAHADRHLMLTSMSRDDQAHEIDGALRVLDAVGTARFGFAFSYAKGAYNDDSLALLRDRDCAIAVTNQRGNAIVGPDALLTLPRFDAKHLPTNPDAAPTEWTSRV
jgi:peptidoglycan/xylan/chitin deacetylase (PgdA/CDA1 family)